MCICTHSHYQKNVHTQVHTHTINKPCKVPHSCNPRTWEVESERSGVQGTSSGAMSSRPAWVHEMLFENSKKQNPGTQTKATPTLKMQSIDHSTESVAYAHLHNYMLLVLKVLSKLSDQTNSHCFHSLPWAVAQTHTEITHIGAPLRTAGHHAFLFSLLFPFLPSFGGIGC